MAYTLTHTETDYDQYNTAPANFREITEQEFSQGLFFHYAPERIEYRQLMNVPGEKYALSVWLYTFHDGTGHGFANDYWAGKVRYFAFGCDHTYRELTPAAAEAKGVGHYGRCWHVTECTQCGHINSYDSSD